VFADYHLRVGEITVDTAPPKGFAVQEQRFDATEVGEAKVVTITEMMRQEEHALGAKVDPFGAAIIVAAGLYIFWREQVKAREAVAPAQIA
jgi:hypothetical protein